MAILLVGLNHRTAPVDIRERIAFPTVELPDALKNLCSHYLFTASNHDDSANTGEVIILSTCNRLEVYAVAKDIDQGWHAIEHYLAQTGNTSLQDLHDHLYFMAGHAVIEHLMRVTAGLDSMILGEPQIAGQVNEAFNIALQTHTCGTILSHLFSEAIRTGKRARTETAISRHTTSASHAAINLIQTKIGDIRYKKVLVIGAGETAELATKALHMHEVRHIFCINRTDERATALASQVEGTALKWQDLPDSLAHVDVVITTTSASTPIITVDAINEAMAIRAARPLVIVDLAVPRDVEVGVGDLVGIHLYDIDALQSVLDANLLERQKAIPQVEMIIQEGMASCLAWFHSRQIVPVIVGFRNKVIALADAEVKQALNHMEGLNQHNQQAVIRLAHRIVNKMLHEPTERLKAHAVSGTDHTYAHAIQDLFALDASLVEIEKICCVES